MNKFESFIINEIKEVIESGFPIKDLRQDLFYSLNLIYNCQFRQLLNEYNEEILDLLFNYKYEGYLDDLNILDSLEKTVMIVIELIFCLNFNDNEEE